MHDYPFKSVGFALAFYISKNPARAKYFNLLEPERGSRPSAQDFTYESPLDLWVEVGKTVHKIMRGLPWEARKIFWLRNAGDRTKQWPKEDIARELGLPAYAVGKWLKTINEELESDLIRKGLIAPKDDDKAA